MSRDPRKIYELGDRFKVRLPKFVGDIPDMADLFRAEDREFEAVDKVMEAFTQSLVVSTIEDMEDPDYFLELLEIDYGLPGTGTTAERVAAILAKMLGRRTTTVEAILEICRTFKHRAEYVPLYEEYAYKLVLIGSRHFGPGFTEALREATPAHLEIRFEQMLGDRLVLDDTGTRLFVSPMYITGTNRHKTGTIYRHQYAGKAVRDRVQMGDRAKAPEQRPPITNEPKAGQVYNLQKGRNA